MFTFLELSLERRIYNKNNPLLRRVAPAKFLTDESEVACDGDPDMVKLACTPFATEAIDVE